MDTEVFLGTDPEVVVVDKNGKAVPAHKLGFGPPDQKTEYARGKMFRDGYMVEMNVPADACRQTMGYAIQSLQRALAKKLKATGHVFLTVPSIKVDLAALEDAPADVRVFGCSPSFDAYTLDAKVPAIDALTHPKRYAGGHLHFSTGPSPSPPLRWMRRVKNYPRAIQLFDAYVGLPLTVMFHRPEQYERRCYYGQAGEFRPQKYPNGYLGVEYRTPGPEVWNHQAVASFAYGMGRWICYNFENLKNKKLPSEAITEGINTGKGRMSTLRSYWPSSAPYEIGIIAGLRDKKLFTPVMTKLDSEEIQMGINEWSSRWGFAGERAVEAIRNGYDLTAPFDE